jgi:hypothetical protein
MKKVNVMLYTYKSIRHYGGREIITTPHSCEANYLYYQDDGTHVVELLKDCANYKAGHKIALLTKYIFFKP